MTLKKFLPDRTYFNIQLALNLVFVAIWYFSNDGLLFWDDYTYLNFAQEINNDEFSISTNHFTSRVALIYPTAWVIKVFGINAITITIFPMLCTTSLLNLLFWLGRRHGHWIGILAGAFLIADYHTITFATHLFPEMPMALCVFGALLCYDFVNRQEGDYRLLALLMSLLLLSAFLIKTTVFILIPLFIYLIINDFRKGNNKGFWRISISLLVFFFLLHGFWYMETFGDFFYRFNNISDNHEASVKTFFDKDFSEVIKRLTYLPLLGFLRGGFFIPLAFALPAILSLKKTDWRLDKSEKLWPVSALLILASWWFFSTNWKYYSPMPVDTRHITFLIPLFLLSGAYFWVNHSWFEKLRQKKLVPWMLILLLAIPAYKILNSGDRNFEELNEWMELIVNDSPGETIYTDGLISYGYPYFYGFENVSDQYIWFSEMGERQPQKGDLLLINPPYLNDRYNDSDNLERFRKLIQTNGWVLDRINSGPVELYRVK